MESTPDALALLGEFGFQGAVLALGAWFGRRFLAMHDRLLEELEEVIRESLRARESMDAARKSMLDLHRRG